VFVAQIKADRADGLTAEEKKTAYEMALARAKSFLSWKELVRLAGSDEKAEEFLKMQLEAAVNEVKKASQRPGIIDRPM